jgi:heterogeneous nuclear ribonucleoprotein M
MPFLPAMFHNQILYERTMTVKMDKMGENNLCPQQVPGKLPTGLKNVGMGLGTGGTPVNIQQLQSEYNIKYKAYILFHCEYF